MKDAILAAITAAIEETIRTMIDERLGALEQRVGVVQAAALKTAERVGVLEDNKGMTADAFATYLDGQEWFWGKLATFATKQALTEDRVEALIENAMDEHTSTYDHDSYDSHRDDDDVHLGEDTVKDAVDEALSGREITVTL